MSDCGAELPIGVYAEDQEEVYRGAEECMSGDVGTMIVRRVLHDTSEGFRERLKTYQAEMSSRVNQAAIGILPPRLMGMLLYLGRSAKLFGRIQEVHEGCEGCEVDYRRGSRGQYIEAAPFPANALIMQSVYRDLLIQDRLHGRPLADMTKAEMMTARERNDGGSGSRVFTRVESGR